MIASSLYPWQQSQWDQLLASKSQKRLPHALLLVGSPGLGKRSFAILWAKTLLCTSMTSPCNNCHSCHLINANSHPDYLLLEPEQAGSMIKIDQVRELIQFTSETALQGNNRVVVIHPASSMNINSANALLKTLEEPGPNTFFILVNDQNGRLPATILSRCQKINFNKPTSEVALEWLAKAIDFDKKEIFPIVLRWVDQAPLKAKEILENGFFNLRQEFYNHLTLLSEQKADVLSLAVHYQDQDVRALLNLFMMWLQDMLRFQMSKGDAELLNSDYQEKIGNIAFNISSKQLLEYYDYIKQMYSYLLGNLNLNRQLMLEELFIRWQQYFL